MAVHAALREASRVALENAAEPDREGKGDQRTCTGPQSAANSAAVSKAPVRSSASRRKTGRFIVAT